MIGITGITICGYKSICEESSIEIRPLTILAGANGSGKSSFMQPLLLLKQTLEAPHDPGALRLDGPIVQFTSVEQFLAKPHPNSLVDSITIGLDFGENGSLTRLFKRIPGKGIEIEEVTFGSKEKSFALRIGMPPEEIRAALQSEIEGWEVTLKDLIPTIGAVAKRMEERGITADDLRIKPRVIRNRFILGIELDIYAEGGEKIGVPPFPIPMPFGYGLVESIRGVIHVPPLRGNPERTYKTTGTGPTFPGTFNDYVASIIHHWQDTEDIRLGQLISSLAALGLTWQVRAKRVNDVQVEIRVGRLPPQRSQEETKDTVSIADVGFGVSQVLPVLVALIVAEPGQMVYIEQPEIHLHPRAKKGLAEVLAEAAMRGIRVVVETHSGILLRSIQALVAEGRLTPELVKLHWFTRREDGATEISSADLDEAGAFGDWPEDFGDVGLEVEGRYLDAAMVRKSKD